MENTGGLRNNGVFSGINDRNGHNYFLTDTKFSKMTNADMLFIGCWVLVLLWILVDMVRVIIQMQEDDEK